MAVVALMVNGQCWKCCFIFFSGWRFWASQGIWISPEALHPCGCDPVVQSSRTVAWSKGEFLLLPDCFINHHHGVSMLGSLYRGKSWIFSVQPPNGIWNFSILPTHRVGGWVGDRWILVFWNADVVTADGFLMDCGQMSPLAAGFLMSLKPVTSESRTRCWHYSGMFPAAKWNVGEISRVL